jgi:very-short-patch-repair endonuclease
MTESDFKNSSIPREGCQPQAERVEYLFSNRATNILPQHNGTPSKPKKQRNRTKGSPYTSEVEVNGILIQPVKLTNLPKNSKLQHRACTMRNASTLPEVLFWMEVTKGRFHKIDFDRQKVIGNYIVDFYAKQLGLVIEIDGSSHVGKEEYDLKRENFLRSLGIEIYRISNGDILYRRGCVMKELEKYIIERYER